MSISSTALKKYQRLETLGLWRPSRDVQRREVIVSFGEATLIISAPNGEALTHWSLNAVSNEGKDLEGRVVFIPEGDSEETLEIADPDMIDAIREVTKAIKQPERTSLKLRYWSFGLAFLAVLYLIFFWFPKAMFNSASQNTPIERRQHFAEFILNDMKHENGEVCSSREGNRALERLQARFPEANDYKFIIMPLRKAIYHNLPGNIVLLNARVLDQLEAPEALAGFLIEAIQKDNSAPPMEMIFHSIGATGLLEYILSGELPEGVLPYFSQSLREAKPSFSNEFDMQISEIFADQGLPISSFANALETLGADQMRAAELRTNDAIGSAPFRPVIEDFDWVALQQICKS